MTWAERVWLFILCLCNVYYYVCYISQQNWHHCLFLWFGTHNGCKSNISLNWGCGWSVSITEWGWSVGPCGVNVPPYTFKLSPPEWLRGRLPQPYPHTYMQQTWNEMFSPCSCICPRPHMHTMHIQAANICARTRTHSLTLTGNHKLTPLAHTDFINRANIPFTWEQTAITDCSKCMFWMYDDYLLYYLFFLTPCKKSYSHQENIY